MDNSIKEFFTEFWFPLFGYMFLFISIVCVPIIITGYFSSCQEARIYNQLNGTNYTCSDFFWAGDQINSQSQTIKLDNK
jgi:hypothetical protein